MNEPQLLGPRHTRNFLVGLGVLGGMLLLTLIQSALNMNLLGCIASLVGILVVAVLHRGLERDIPRGVDSISTQVAQMPEEKRIGLRDFLKDKNRQKP